MLGCQAVALSSTKQIVKYDCQTRITWVIIDMEEDV